MGLDMYLDAEMYVSDYPGGPNYELAAPIETLLLFNGVGVRGLKEMTFRVGYWRKANAIHNWFVQNVQNGEDNCRRCYVATEDLERLKHECEVVIARKEQGIEIDKELEGVDLLPPTAGFFFGSSEIDDGYYQDLKDTIAVVDKALTMNDKIFDFYYSSSW